MGEAVSGRIEHLLPGVAATLWRPGASLPAEQGYLTNVITVVGDDLPESGANGRLPRRMGDAKILDHALQLGRVGICQVSQLRQQFDKALPRSLPLRLTARLGMRRPAFNGVIGIAGLFAGDAGEVMIHPIIHVQDDLPDGVRITGNAEGSKFSGQIFDASDGIDVGAFAVDEFAQCGLAHRTASSATGLISSPA